MSTSSLYGSTILAHLSSGTASRFNTTLLILELKVYIYNTQISSKVSQLIRNNRKPLKNTKAKPFYVLFDFCSIGGIFYDI